MYIKRKLYVYIAVFVCFLNLLSSCSKQTENALQTGFLNQPENISETESPQNTDEADEVVYQSEISSVSNTELDAICKNYGAVGVQSAIILNGKVTFTYEYGISNKPDTYVTADTKFRVASLSKLATNIVFMALRDEKLVDETADISDYLGFSVRNPYYIDTVITAEQLMTHRSSICDSSAFLSSRQNHSSTNIKTLLESSSSFCNYKPGSSYNYSNFNNAIVGAICEKVTGKCFEELAEKYLFEPLDIDAAYVASNIDDKSLIGELYGNGGYSISQQLSESFCDTVGQTHHIVQGNLTISAKDYAKIICVLINDGKTENGRRILSKESVDSIISDCHCGYSDTEGYGLWFTEDLIQGKKTLIHTGSNFGMFSAFAFNKEDGSGVVVLTSGAGGTKTNSVGIYDICYDIIRFVYSDLKF